MSDKKDKIKFRQYMKNLGLSSSEVIRQAIEDNPVFFLGTTIKDEVAEYLQARKENPKEKLSKKIKRKFWEWLDKDRMEEGSYKDDVDKIKKSLMKGISTGDFREKERLDFMSMFDDDPELLFSDDPDFESFGESYLMKGETMSIEQLLKDNLDTLKIIASRESLDVLTPIEPLNDKIESNTNEILSYVDETNNRVNDGLLNELNECDYNHIKDKILGVISTVATNAKIEDKYKDVLASQIAVLFCNNVRFHTTGLPDESTASMMDYEKSRILNDIDNTGASRVSSLVQDKLEPTKEILDEWSNKANLGILNDIEDNSNMSAFAGGEKEAYGENEIAAIGGLGISIISVLVIPLIAIAKNSIIQGNIDKLESKYGSNFTFKVPMIISDNISNSTASKYSKAIEVKNLMEMKGLIESTAARQDGGSVITRAAKNNKLLSPLKIETKDIANTTYGVDATYEDIISAFSESGRNFFKPSNDDLSKSLVVLSHVANRDVDGLSLINSLDPLVARGEEGDFIDLKRNALPTYMEVNVDYEFAENIMALNTKKQTRKTTVGLQILPRKIASADILKTLNELVYKFFETVSVTKEERGLLKKAKNLFNFWDKKIKTQKELKALKSNSFADIVNKIAHIKTPLFHLVISYADYMELKNLGTNLMDRVDYARVMDRLPLASLTIVDEDSDILYLSDGPVMSYIRHSLEDFIDTVSQYEKDLKTIIKYNQM